MNLSQTVEWVPVGERLPESWTVPLMLATDYGSVFVGGHRNDGDFHDLNLHDLYQVTHWALPLKHPNQIESEQKQPPSLSHYLETL